MDLIEFVRGPGGPRKKAWDSSPHKPVPSNLRGIKPISYEPWAIDAKRYYDQNKDMSKFALYDDRSVLATSKGYKSTITKTGWNPTQEWDSSPCACAITPPLLKPHLLALSRLMPASRCSQIARRLPGCAVLNQASLRSRGCMTRCFITKTRCSRRTDPPQAVTTTGRPARPRAAGMGGSCASVSISPPGSHGVRASRREWSSSSRRSIEVHWVGGWMWALRTPGQDRTPWQDRVLSQCACMATKLRQARKGAIPEDCFSGVRGHCNTQAA